MALGALAIDHFIALPQLFEHRAEQLGRILQVGIEHEDDVAAHVVEPSGQCQLVPVVARQVDRDDPRIMIGMLADRVPAAVLRPVIDEDELVPLAELGVGSRGDARDQRIEPRFLVIDRDDDGQLDRAGKMVRKLQVLSPPEAWAKPTECKVNRAPPAACPGHAPARRAYAS